MASSPRPDMPPTPWRPTDGAGQRAVVATIGPWQLRARVEGVTATASPIAVALDLELRHTCAGLCIWTPSTRTAGAFELVDGDGQRMRLVSRDALEKVLYRLYGLVPPPEAVLVAAHRWFVDRPEMKARGHQAWMAHLDRLADGNQPAAEVVTLHPTPADHATAEGALAAAAVCAPER